MDTYPCPACGTPADPAHGCPGCQLPPDPETTEVFMLAATIADLNVAVERARTAYEELTTRRAVSIERHNLLVARIRSRSAPVPPPPAPVAGPARPEASGRTVQNVLFVLGGLLLGSAAIVFTAVAWANFGVGGRAAILAVVTVLTLAVPPVARVRRLAGTAETFAALGLLLVLLDGYAAWLVNLADVTGVLTPTRYAAVVFAVTAALGAGYRWATRLTGPGYAAVALVQPVPLLALSGTGLGPAGWSAVLAVLALTDVALAARLRSIPGQVLAWVFAGTATLLALPVTLVAETTASWIPGASRAGAALVLVALVPMAAGFVARGQRWLRVVAGTGLVWALLVAGGRVLVLALPQLRLAPIAAELLVLALAAALLPPGLRSGPRWGVLTAAGLAAVAPVLLALGTATAAVRHALAGDFRATATGVHGWLPATVVLLTAAVAVPVPRRVRVAPVVCGMVVLALVVPASVPLPWWGPSTVDGVAAVALALGAALTRSRVRAAWYGGGALLLAGHAVLVGLGRAGTTAAVLGALLVLAAATAVLARGAGVRAVATGIGLAVPAGLGAALALTAGVAPVPYAAGGLVLSTAAVLALRRYGEAGVLAVPVAGVGVLVGCVAWHDGWYLGVPVLCAGLVGVAVLPRLTGARAAWYRPWYAVPAVAVATVPALAVLLDATALLLEPYGWLGSVWTGVPAGVGLVPPGTRLELAYGLGPDAVTEALVALTLLVGLRRLGKGAAWAALPGVLALVSGTAAVGAPWPAVPAVTLGLGVTAALLAAVRPAPWLGPVAVLATGAGLAGALPTKASTLGALAVVVVAAVVCGAVGRPVGARAAGWVGAVASGALLAFTGARTLEAAPYLAAFWVLTVAGLAMWLSGWLGGWPGRAVEASAHGAALVALLLTAGVPRYPALVLGLWGIALGLRAVWPDEPATARTVRVVAGIGCGLAAYWLLLWEGGVRLTEAYTVPLAAGALLAGWLAARARPALHSWAAYGPALVAAFGPSLALVLTVPGEPARRLAVGLAGVAVVVAGAVRRRQAPVVVGGACLAVLAVHEAVLLWDLLPRWIPLAAAGLVLVGLAVTYERRRRDLTRLRTAVGQMH